VKFRRRRSILPRVDWRRNVDAQPLKGQVWTRSEKSLRSPDVHVAWRALAAVAAVVETALLGWLLFGPALAVQAVDVSGQQHLTSAQVLAAGGVEPGRSVLWINGRSARDRLLDQTWIRAATVNPQLPGKVTVTVAEWQPVAAYRSGATGKFFLMSNQAVILGPATAAGAPTAVQGPAGVDPRAGDKPLDPVLLTALVNIQRGLPGLIGQKAGLFIFDSCGDLTLVSTHGWKVYFGRVLTPEEFSTLRDKLAALKAIAGNGNVDYNSADLEYVNVMNPAEPAVGYKSLEPSVPSPSPNSSTPPSPSASPIPACR
jgi:hypothetical protein